MLFQSIEFLVFFVVVFVLYWLAQGRSKWQNWVLLLASYFFYGYAAWKMLPLMLISTIVFYYLGIGIAQAKSLNTSRCLKTLGVVLGIGILFYFKYFNFFIDEFGKLLSGLGLQNNIHSFGIIMPMGISYFTFKLISYVIEIHHKKFEPTCDFVAFATYIAFFPGIMAGPIDRPKFINQLIQPRSFNYITAADGCRQILWGLFKKVAIADQCATYVNMVWGDIHSQSGSTLVLAMIMYFFQMYSDFSGYSDMAIGIGKLLNLKMTKNFNAPLFSLNMADFWRRWHMSLTTWITDYVFMPLNIKFRDLGNWGILLAIIINMVLVGLWHGANWTYGLFGLYHGILFIPLIFSGAFNKKVKIHTYQHVDIPVFKDFCKVILTLSLFIAGMIIFRANSIDECWDYLCGICNVSLFSIPCLLTRRYYIPLMILLLVMIMMEWINRKSDHGLCLSGIHYSWCRYLIYILLLTSCFWYSSDAETYLYVQF